MFSFCFYNFFLSVSVFHLSTFSAVCLSVSVFTFVSWTSLCLQIALWYLSSSVPYSWHETLWYDRTLIEAFLFLTSFALFTSSVWPHRYWHRSLNPRKLIEVKFSHLSRNMTMQRTLKLYKLPDETKTKVRFWRRKQPFDCRDFLLRWLGEYGWCLELSRFLRASVMKIGVSTILTLSFLVACVHNFSCFPY